MTVNFDGTTPPPRPVAGFRKMTPAMIQSQHLATDGVRATTSKRQVAMAVKTAAPALGVDGVAFHIFDMLLGMARSDDFSKGRRPVVSISNEKLCGYVQRSTRTVSRALRRLCEAGVLSYHDSPSGKRFAQAKSGEAYGLDLSPAANRVAELERLAADFKQALAAQKQAQRAVTRYTRQIIDLEPVFVEVGCDYCEIKTQLDKVLASATSCADKAESLAIIYAHGCAVIALDLSPAANRVAELERLAADFKQALAAQKQAQRAVTRYTRQIIDLEPVFVEVGCDYCEIKTQLDKVLASATSCADKAESLAIIYAHGCAVIALDNADPHPAPATDKALDMSPVGDKIDPHLHITIPQTFINSNETRPLSDERDFNLSDKIKRPAPDGTDISLLPPPAQSRRVKKGFEDQPVGEASARQAPAGDILHALSIGLLATATRTCQTDFGFCLQSWADLADNAETLRLAAQLSQSNWKRAVAAIGLNAAASVLLVAVEKTLRGHSQIKNTAGYFCACIERAKDGKLALSRSVWGLSNA
ncbi:replication initiation protein RepC [Flexibacterium corallicola]|uniref:replication initiation protein RepC n=1 Tax=Flexibacterium corallicola TaxID=3037259 RepID=UPI00286EE890|nr:replication initiation protein RepC [Pseudovibrio sp. M1P-2-3]